MEKEPKEELKKYSDLANKYAEKNGLLVMIGIDGDFDISKKFSDDNIDTVVGLRFIEKKYFAVNIYWKKLIDSAYNELVKPIINTGDDVIFINRDITERNIGGLIILNTRDKKQK